jgi:exodeoxyribonuclease-3
MPLSVATWNINSVRLRAASVRRLMDELAPDILCLQECKAPVDRLPDFADAGYPWRVARGQKGYNGVAILSRVPIEDAGHIDMCGRGDARHVAARTESGVVVHNFYVPAGGDLPDPAANPKFAHKLDFLAELAARFGADPPRRAILAGDHNVAPRPDDVWSHRQLSVTRPSRPRGLEAARAAGGWTDVVRGRIPTGQLYTWWSYRSPDWARADKGRRLDHIWATADLAGTIETVRGLKAARGWDRPSDHVPVVASFDVPG